jgi:hypothetical protein
MRALLISYLMLANVIICYGQNDSLQLRYRNVISYELGGNMGFGFNINYQRLFPVKDFSKVNLGLRAGIGISTRKPNPTILQGAIDASILLGEKPLKFELGLGYTPTFGSRTITVFDYWTDPISGPAVAVTKDVEVQYYDSFLLRIGAAIVPRSSHFLFFRIAWTPVLIPFYMPAPYNSRDDSPQTPKRVYAGWGGITVGVLF